MKRLQIVALVVALLVMGMSLVQFASADPISPPSAGCQIAFVDANETNSFTLSSSFYDEDTLHFVTDVAVNIHVTDSFGFINTTYTNVTSMNYLIGNSENYAFVVTPASGSTFHLNLSCTSTPISGMCIVTNDNFTGSITYNGDYDAGEQVHVTSNVAVNFTVSGTANASYLQITNQYYTFPTSGPYTLTVHQSYRGTTATGTVTCTLPRRR